MSDWQLEAQVQDGYTTRIVDGEIDELIAALPAIVLEGAKAVGKTATAERRAGVVRRFDEPATLAIAQADPQRMLEGSYPVLLDEWQRLPELWDRVRRAVDAGSPPGSFLMTGSAIPASLPAHSGAGRISSVRMRPMSMFERGMGGGVGLAQLLTGARDPIEASTEVGIEEYAVEIVRSGFPGMRRLQGRAHRAQLDSYIDTLATRDFMELGHRVRSPQALRRWMVSYAAATSMCSSYETIRDGATSGEGAKPARSTTQPYRETLERLFLLDPVPGWRPTRNTVARLSVPPKHHLADPALAARLLGVDERSLLEIDAGDSLRVRNGTLLGALFESLVTLSVRVYAQRAECRVGHLRTKAGEREIDLIVERADGRVLAIEVKLSAQVDDDDVRHLRWLADQIGTDLLDAVIVTTGAEAYRRADGIAVIPAAVLGP